MPHPNRFPSSPGLRDPSTQALDELLLSRRSSMYLSKPPPLHTSIRRFSSRRPQPSIASIADLFVGSLVLAGFCHEHSPRTRSMSTLQSRRADGNGRRYRANPATNGNQLPTRRYLEPTGLPSQSSPRRLWLSRGLAHTDVIRVEHKRHLNTRATAAVERNLDSNYSDLAQTEDGPLDEQHGRRCPLSIMGPSEDLTNSTAEAPINSRGSEAHVEAARAVDKRTIRRDERVRLAVTQLFHTLLGDDDGLEHVIKAMNLKEPAIKRSKNNNHDDLDIPAVAALVEALPSSVEVSTQYLFRLYRELPSPGVAHLGKLSRGRLLRRFAHPPNRRWADARRFLALVEDMVSAGLPMSRSLWSSAIHMCGRSNNGKVTKRRLINAIGLWQQMEHVAGIPADDVVFNILFDTAIKANQFMVASRLEDEMQKRGIRYSRDGFVSKIFSQGMLRDLHGIRKTFNDFVAAGELVDTVVMNCMISSFLRAGDTKTADQLYSRMIQAQRDSGRSESSTAAASAGLPSLSSEFAFYRAKTRELGRLLKMAKSLHKRLPEYHRAIQDALSITPDTRTFWIMLQHCARSSGNLDMFMTVVNDMECTFGVPPRHIIYLLLFEGFGFHGRRRNTAWTAEKLRLTFQGFVRAVRESKARSQSRTSGSSSVIWENPLREKQVDAQGSLTEAEDKPDGFYITLPSKESVTSSSTEVKQHSTGIEEPTGLHVPLPLEGARMDFNPGSLGHSTAHLPGVPIGVNYPHGGFHNTAQENHNGEANEPEHEPDDNAIEELENLDFFDSRRLKADRDNELSVQKHEYVTKRLENGVFVGRRMIIVILRAFGSCCGPREVMEAWLQLDQLWPSSKRKTIDVIAIKEVLDEQMAK